ncbi:MAG: hypothetical protein ACKVW3_13090 [Phycisphaerales bacterium]
MSNPLYCVRCTRLTSDPVQVEPYVLCRECRTRDERQDRVIATKFDQTATPELPFGAQKEPRRANR